MPSGSLGAKPRSAPSSPLSSIPPSNSDQPAPLPPHPTEPPRYQRPRALKASFVHGKHRESHGAPPHSHPHPLPRPTRLSCLPNVISFTELQQRLMALASGDTHLVHLACRMSQTFFMCLRRLGEKGPFRTASPPGGGFEDWLEVRSALLTFT